MCVWVKIKMVTKGDEQVALYMPICRGFGRQWTQQAGLKPASTASGADCYALESSCTPIRCMTYAVGPEAFLPTGQLHYAETTRRAPIVHVNAHTKPLQRTHCREHIHVVIAIDAKPMRSVGFTAVSLARLGGGAGLVCR